MQVIRLHYWLELIPHIGEGMDVGNREQWVGP